MILVSEIVRRRTAAAWVILLLFYGVGQGAVAAVANWDLRREFPDSAWRWSVPEAFDLPDAHVRMQRFAVALDLSQTAKRLARSSTGRFPRLQVAGSTLWLSGLVNTVHWLVQLQAAAGGTVGLVSSLTPRSDAAADFDARHFAPADARRVLQMSSRDAGSVTMTRLDCAGIVADILEQVRRNLRTAHWQSADVSAGSEIALAADWRHPTKGHLMVLYEIHAGRVVLTFWHRPSEAPS